MELNRSMLKSAKFPAQRCCIHVISYVERELAHYKRMYWRFLEGPVPDSMKTIRTFTDLVNFYNKYFRNSESITQPLYRVISGNKLHWTRTCQNIFLTVQKILTSESLAYHELQPENPFTVTIDAVIPQYHDGEEQSLGYASTSFNDSQLRLSPTDQYLEASGLRLMTFILF